MRGPTSTYLRYLDETPLRDICLRATSGDASADSVLESSSNTVESVKNEIKN